MQGENLTCKVCGITSENKVYAVREMMFGLQDDFIYFECGNCGCLQIKDIPADLSKYYPPEYYSFKNPAYLTGAMSDSYLKSYLRRKRTFYAMYNKGMLGRLLLALYPISNALAESLEWLKKCNASFDSKILDVGCGKGRLLLELSRCGFSDLTGVDPYLDSDIVYKNKVRVLRKELSEIEDTYHVIMFHHSLEHMRDPGGVFRDIARLLYDEGGHAVIRTPTVSSFAWRHYGQDWVQIDAPRHFFLHSLKSIEILAKRNGLKIKEIIFDSTEFQFWGSQQYKRGIALFDHKAYCVRPADIISSQDMRLFKLKALALNREKAGDQVCVYLAKN